MDGQQVSGIAGTLVSLFPMILILVVFYFMLIRPQRKKEKKLREMLAALKVGDEVASIGGIHGKITRIKDDIFVLETGIGTSKSYISIERAAISRLISQASKKEEVAPIPDEEPTEAE